MSETEPTRPYIYQPFGMQDVAKWNAKRIYAIGGLNHLATVEGLTKDEASRKAPYFASCSKRRISSCS